MSPASTYRPVITWTEFLFTKLFGGLDYRAIKNFYLPLPLTHWDESRPTDLIVHPIPHSDIVLPTGGSQTGTIISLGGWIYPPSDAIDEADWPRVILEIWKELRLGFQGNQNPRAGTMKGFFNLYRYSNSEGYRACRLMRDGLRSFRDSSYLYRMRWSASVISAHSKFEPIPETSHLAR